MEKRAMLYQGKAKKLYATDDPDLLWVEYTNQATAGNGEKKAQIEGKGQLNNRITSLVFTLLKTRGIASHFVQQLSENEQLVRHMDMIALEIIVRNKAAGSFARRYGIDEGVTLTHPLVEFCVKSDELGDPFISPDAIVALDMLTQEDLQTVTNQALALNTALQAIFHQINIDLVDFKVEMGRSSSGEILLADEITPDTCRLWNELATGRIEHLDKDLFRRDIGDIIPAYREICNRLESLAQQ